MSFTVKCDKCGSEQVFNHGDKARNNIVDMEIGMTRGYQQYPEEITFFCMNWECNNIVDLKY